MAERTAPHVNEITQHWIDPKIEVSLEITSAKPLTTKQWYCVKDVVQKIEYMLARVAHAG